MNNNRMNYIKKKKIVLSIIVLIKKKNWNPLFPYQNDTDPQHCPEYIFEVCIMNGQNKSCEFNELCLCTMVVVF